jgi:hypothetical protein
MTREDAFALLKTNVESLYEVCNKMNWGDPFASGRIREIILVNTLGHEIADTLHNEDATGIDGLRREYKTQLNSRSWAGRYDVSRYPTWEEQEHYLRHEKIGNCVYHYFASFTEDNILMEIYAMSGAVALGLIMPKIKAQYHEDRTNKKHQDLYATLSGSDIITNSIKIFDRMSKIDLISEHESMDAEAMAKYKKQTGTVSLEELFG